MIENEIKDFINTIIKEEGGREIKREDLLSLSDIDSFGYIVLYTQIQERYGIDIIANENIDYKIYTLENLIKDIQEHSKLVIATKSYEIEKITQKDLQKICKVLIHELDDKTFIKQIRDHIRHGISYKMVVDDKIKAFFLAKRFKTHYSLSYYYVDKDLRKKISSLFFFLHAFDKFKKLPIYIKTNKNFADYERYFEATTEDKIYKFKGLREDGAWAELLKL